MAAVQRILVPVDGSPPSIAALDHAVALAEDSGASVDVLHVDAPDEFAVGSTAAAAESSRREDEQARDAAFERAAEHLEGRIARRTLTGDPVRVILETAANGAYDVIVMGTHGRVGRLHAMLGSVAEAVVRNAPCPVLSVREPGGSYQSFAERLHGRRSLGEQVGRHHA